MRILMGVCGEGSGHATRSKVVALHLLDRGHEILAACQGSAALRPFKAIDHPRLRLVPTVGATFAEGKGGGIDLRAALEATARRLPGMMTSTSDAWAEALLFQPEAAITDYDSFSWLFAKARRLPVVSVGNHHVLVSCFHEPDVLPPGVEVIAHLTRLKASACDHYIITSVFFPPLRPEYAARTTLVPPVLRPNALTALDGVRPAGDHFLVYKSAYVDDATVLQALIACPEVRFRVYGLKADASVPSNVERRAFDEDAFLTDLAGARGVVSNGGMSLMGEAVAFGKPMHVVPAAQQHEQILNANYIERLGYGTQSARLEPRGLRAFIERVPAFAATLGALPRHDKNERLYATLDALFGAHQAPSPARGSGRVSGAIL